MQLNYRFATIREVDIYYNWVNDPIVRKNSYNISEISYKQHLAWFTEKLLNKKCFLYYFEVNNIPAGQVRIESKDLESIIGISIDKHFRGKSLAHKMLVMASTDFLNQNCSKSITAYIKKDNKNSYSAFSKAGYVEKDIVTVSDILSYKMIKSL